jgi:RNA polymerase sigma-70 factor (ECF subfamily)
MLPRGSSGIVIRDTRMSRTLKRENAMTDVEACTQPADDAALVNQARAGDSSAFDQLIRRHRARLLRIADAVTQSRADAEDALQDALLQVHRNLHRFEGRSKFTSWVTRIVVNAAIVRRRHVQRHRFETIHSLNPDGIDIFERIIDPNPNPESLYQFAQKRIQLNRAFRALPETYRAVLLLRIVRGLSIQQTAEALGVRVPLVKSRLFRARLQLRQRLERGR